MNIVSYRGPGRPGGVSSSLDQLFHKFATPSSSWWFVEDQAVSFVQAANQQKKKRLALSQNIVDEHYRFANEFLWPVMHDMPERSAYKLSDYKSYYVLNKTIASNLPAADDGWYFINDYQFALMPMLLNGPAATGGALSFAFWHIPWPKNVAQAHVPILREIVRGLLGTKRLGFHTKEYAQNFMSFVSRYMYGYEVDFEQRQIYAQASTAKNKRTENTIFRLLERRQTATQIVVAPLAIDFDYWAKLSLPHESTACAEIKGLNLPFVLSADRADYTKGIKERIEAIKIFFDENPSWKEKVSFVQICPRTRPGLTEFDSYWHECRTLSQSLLDPLAASDWKPLIWLNNGLSQNELAMLYRKAEVMLVNPIRDGLNLTAKEFVACQTGKPGALALSSGAGVFHELGDHCLKLDPHKPKQISSAILKALKMTPMEKAVRISLMKEELRKNNFAFWCDLIAPEVSRRALRMNQPSSAS